MNTRILVICMIAAPLFAQEKRIELSQAYRDCNHSATSAAADRIQKCEEAAKAGIPGAQYALGALLTKRNEGEDRQRGVAWLEKAVATGHPAAAFHLARVLDGQDNARARELLQLAVCSGYPPAQKYAPAFRCMTSPHVDFSGEWVLSLKWEKSSIAENVDRYRIAIDGNQARVSMKIDDKWTEVKEGSFKVTQLGETIIIVSVDDGWNLDGKWIESWTIQLLRTSADEATAVFLRTVNNAQVPAQFAWQTFSSYAEGTASRVTQ